MKPLIMALAAFWLTVTPPKQAFAQTGPISRNIVLSFNGVVSNDVVSSIRIRQPDGSYASYTGPMPDFPYRQGDPVTISFNATVPTADYYTSGAYNGQVAADGIYRIALHGPNNPIIDPGNVGNTSLFDVSGPIGTVLNAFQGTGLSGLTVVYDANTDSYSLDFGLSGWAMSTFDGPGFAYDPTSGTVSPVNSTCAGASPASCINVGDGGFAIRGGTTAASATATIYGPDATSPAQSIRWGLFDMLFAGSWSLPTYGSSGGAVDVPEPGTLFLFGGGAYAAMRRRRKARALA